MRGRRPPHTYKPGDIAQPDGAWRDGSPSLVTGPPRGSTFSDHDISFGMCLCLMSWVQQVHSAAVVARSLGCQCDTEIMMPGQQEELSLKRASESHGVGTPGPYVARI